MKQNKTMGMILDSRKCTGASILHAATSNLVLRCLLQVFRVHRTAQAVNSVFTSVAVILAFTPLSQLVAGGGTNLPGAPADSREARCFLALSSQRGQRRTQARPVLPSSPLCGVPFPNVPPRSAGLVYIPLMVSFTEQKFSF